MKILSITKSKGQKLVGGTLPDIDTDFPGAQRYLIKEYMEKRFGESQVCSVGTYTTMRPKGIIKDFDRQFENDYKRANLITSVLGDDDGSMEEIIAKACKEPLLKKYIKDNTDIFYLMPTIMDQPKTKSIHSCAMIVFPKIMNAGEWTPIRKQQGLVVSEWTGTEMDDAGFLKLDILGIKQLDKFTDILNLIRENGKEVPDIYNLDLYDKEVYRYFGNGWNGDVFQLGTEGLTDYSRSLKPQDFNDLIAAVALYRPGPMENHYHEIYAKCKNEGRQPVFYHGCEEITKNTYGLFVYQEQIMQVCQQVGGLSMREADDVRRAMGKKKLEPLEEWKPKMSEGFQKNGYTEAEFIEVWNVMVEFAKYSFNLSHSAVYAMLGYISQYLKVHYPLEYWTVALDYAKEEKVPKFLSEIFQAKEIKISPPDVNKSEQNAISDHSNKTIYWGYTSIKGVGEVAAGQLQSVRKEHGDYESLDDFLEKNLFKGSKVNKTTIEALITCGAFDELHELKNPQERLLLLNEYRIGRGVKVDYKKDKYSSDNVDKFWWWKLRQKELIGLVFVDYDLIDNVEGEFATTREINEHQNRGIFRTYGGYVVEVNERSGKKGRFARILIESNYRLITLMVWNEEYVRFKKELKKCDKSFVLFSGNLRYEDKWTKGNQFTLTKDSFFKVYN